MFDSIGGEGVWVAVTPDGVAPPGGVVEQQFCEVWDEQDWSRLPVRKASDEPPAGWDSDQCESGETWLDRVAEPQLGPVEWLRELEPSSLLMGELEGLRPDLVDSDSDAVEMVAHWHRLEAYCALRKRLAAAELARRQTMTDGLAALKNLGKRTSDPNIAGDELALRLGVGRRAAATLVRTGRALTGVGIPTAEALQAGHIDAAKADVIIAGISDLSPMAALQVQDTVLPQAAHTPSGSVRKALAAAVAAVDPEHFEERTQRAMQNRRVDRPRTLPDGMASMFAVLPAVEATQLYRAVDAAARSAKTTGDGRTLDQLRADALALMGATAIQSGWIGPAPAPPDLAVTDGDDCDCTHRQPHISDLPDWAQQEAVSWLDHTGDQTGGDDRSARDVSTDTDSRADSGDPRAAAPPGARKRDGPQQQPVPHEDAQREERVPRVVAAGGRMRVGVIGGRSAHVRVVVPLTTVMGGEDGPGADLRGSNHAATLEGYGPIPATVARALAAGGPWARMVTDPVDRSVLEVSQDVYTPPQAMADLIRARDPECARPGCSVPSDSCDLNHRIPWPIGATSVANIDPGCRRDHLLITHGGWAYWLDEDTGDRTWRTAAGLTYIEDRDGNLIQLRNGKTPEQIATAQAAREDHDRRYAGPPPF